MVTPNGDDRKATPHRERGLEFLRECRECPVHFKRSRSFGRRVRDIGLLEPMHAQLTTP